jgi:hypothetical protein
MTVTWLKWWRMGGVMIAVAYVILNFVVRLRVDFGIFVLETGFALIYFLLPQWWGRHLKR